MNWKTFGALIERDLRVLIRNFFEFLLRIAVQPLMLAFVFGYVLPRTGDIPSTYANLIVPGIVGISVMTSGVQGTAIPLAWDFGATREIEDRLLAPINVNWVLWEKIIVGAIQSLAAGAIVFPVTFLLMRENLNIQVSSYLLLFVVIILSSLISASLGMTLGTIVEPMKFAIMFATVIIPMVFLGATYYPWASLDNIPWFKWAITLNPLLYVNEGYRAILTPQIPHMNIYFSILGMVVSITILLFLARFGFNRRAFS